MKLLSVSSLSLVVACATPPDESSTAQSVWSNGDFESDTVGSVPTGWTRATNLGQDLTDTRPSQQTLASLNLTSGGTAMTFIVGGATETQIDPDVGASGTFRYPKYGQRAVRLNYLDAASPGKNANSNTLKQTMYVTQGDVDPTDDKVHVRFALAPILENPNHSYIQQPYYFVRLQNLTKATTLYSDFNASGQPGVPWKNFTDASGQAAQYTDWQLVDISPGNASLAVGDQVELTVIATGCSPGGHWGRVYLDAVGSGIPGLYAWGTGPQQANAGTNIVYTLNYKNGGTTTTSGTMLDFVTPPNTTFQSVSAAGCTVPSVNSTGTVSCPLGTLGQGATGAFTVTVAVPAGTANGTVITNGNYSIYATGVSALVGPKVQTTVTSGVSYADAGITISDGIAALAWAQATRYTMVASNTGPLAMTGTVALPMPTNATSMSWSCDAGGSSCGSGSGAINHAVSLAVGASQTYTVDVTLSSGSGSASSVATASISVGGGKTDPDSTDNTAVDTNSVGQLRTLTITNTNAPQGTVVSSPSTINCGATCTGDFLDGSAIVLTATPIAGATFVGWSGACSGTATTCNLTMDAAKAATANFVGAPSAATTTSGGGAQTTGVSTVFATPLSVTVRDANGNGVPGLTVTFTANGATANASLSAASAVTDATGTASVTATANATPGAYTASATVPGLAAPISFALRNVGAPTQLTLVAGTPQSTAVMTAYTSLSVLVRDAASYPLPNVTVAYARPASTSASIAAAANATTNASGIASLSATANTIAGAFTVTASVGAMTVPFSLTNVAGGPGAITIVSGNNQTQTVAAQFGANLVAKVTDAYGNPLAGRTVSFTSDAQYVTLAPSSATTAANGEASLAKPTAAGRAGAYQIIASDGALAVSFDTTNTAGAPATLTRTSTNPQSTQVTTAFAPLSVTCADAYGNSCTGSVAFAAPGSGASATVSSPVAFASGAASTAAVANTVTGTYVVTATAGSVQATFDLTNTPGAPASIAYVSGSPQSATVDTNFAAPLRARVRDAHNNVVPNVSVTFSAPASGARASTGTGTTDASGIASFTPKAGTVVGSYAMTAQATGTSTVSFSLTNTVGAIGAIASTSGGGQSTVVATRFAQDLTATVTDAFGNPVSGATVTFTAAATPATATPDAATATTNASGVATMGITASQKTGGHVMTAQAGAFTTTYALTNTPGTATHVTAVSGGGQSAVVDAAFASALVARITDTYANVVPGVMVAIGAPHASFSPAQQTSDASGLVSFDAVAGTTATSYVATATIPGASATFALTNTPGAAAEVTIAGGDAQEQIISTAFPALLDVVVKDAHGNAVPGATVTFTAPSSGATATVSAPAATGTDGHTTAQATAGTKVGTYTVTASSGTGSAPFTLANLPGAAATIAVTGGDAQEAVVDAEFADDIEVLVRDAGSNPVPGATVTFTAPSSVATASLSHASRQTGADGKTRIRARAGQKIGSYRITAAIPAQSVDVALKNTHDVPASIAVASASSPQTTTVTQLFALPLAVRVADRFDNPVPSATVTLEVPATGASVTVTSMMTTDDDGLAAAAATANGIAGAYVVLARVGAVGPAVFSLTNIAGAPAELEVAGGGTQATVVDTAFGAPLLVRVRDANGNVVPGATVHYAAPSVGYSAALSADAAASDVDGLARVTATANTVAGTYDVVATLDGAAAPVAFALTNRAGVPVSITVDAAATPQAARVATPFVRALGVTVRDTFGNGVPQITVSYEAPPTGATASLAQPTAITGPTGKASVIASAGNTTGTYGVTASIPGGLSGTFALANLQGEPAHVAIVGGGEQHTVVDTTFAAPLVVEVRDEFDNVVVGRAVEFTAPGTDATAILSASSVTTDAAGRAQVTAKASTTTGGYTVSASASSGASPVGFALVNTADAPASIVADAQASQQSTEVGHAFALPLAVTVRDQFGNRVPDAQVTYGAPTFYATLSQPTAQTDTNGRASVIAVASTIATAYVATATVGALTATFALENTSSAPGSIVLVSGGGQHARATAAFAAPVVAMVIDAFGNPVPDAEVTAAMPSSGASATMATPMTKTDADGLVSAELVANGVVGDFALVLRSRGALTPLTVPLAVDAIPTTTTATAGEISVDEPLHVDVAVDAALGTAEGEVELVEGDLVIATATLDGGKATITTSAPQPGKRTYRVRYGAHGAFAASTSASVTVEVADDSGSLSGGSGACNTSGGNASWLVVVCGAMLMLRRRRAAVVAVAVACAQAAQADQPAAGARAIDRMHSAAADSEWFAVDSLGFEGHRDVTVEVLNDYAYHPLVAYDGAGNERGVIVSHSYVMQVGASVSLAERFRLSATVPFSTYQTGSDTMFNGVMLRAPVFAFGDVTVAGDVRMVGTAHSSLRVAAGIRFALPTGSRTNYMSDGVFGIEPRVMVAGGAGRFEYAAVASLMLREQTELAHQSFGGELRASFGAGARFGKLLVGPELVAARSLETDMATGTPTEVALGASYQVHDAWRLGLGASLGLSNAVGVPDQRALLSLTWLRR